MSGTPDAPVGLADERRWGLALAVLLILSGMSSAQPSFLPGFALAKLGVGLLHLVGIGWATSRVLGLSAPRNLAGAGYMLLGQIVALAYVYSRSALCSATGLPGISVPEVLLVEGVLGWSAIRRGLLPVAISWRPSRVQLPSLLLYALWLSWLAFIALQKLDLLYTPSSDPDIHTFYTKILVERGHLYYDLMPFSDAWMVYPSGFSCLNLVLGLLSGLHPVQLVNIGPYLQFTLFCGAAFSVLSESLKPTRSLLLLGLFHFFAAYLCFNSVLAPNRELLQGTPRLAHSALLFFPLFFVAQHGRQIGKRPWLLALPLCAVITGMCINPTHAPAALLFGACAIALVFSDRETRRDLLARGVGTQAMTALLLATLAIVFLVTDPFYRSLLGQQTSSQGQVEEAHDLTGNAFSLDLDVGAVTRQVAARVPYKLVTNPGGGGGTRTLQIALLAGLLGLGFAELAARRRADRKALSDEPRLLAFAAAMFAALVIHAFWSEATPHLVRPGVLQSRLLVRYSQALQYQISTLFFACTFTLLLVAVITRGHKPREAGTRPRLSAGLIGLAIAVGSLPWLGPAALSQARIYYPELRETSLGLIYPSDLEFIRRARSEIGREERVLLPGRLRRSRNEHWIFTTRAGRAVPLFSDIRTSFFLGLDGWAFTADAYEAHVQPPHFDPEWLRSHEIHWLVESGNFPPRILANHYERVFGDDHAVLWRLRPPNP